MKIKYYKFSCESYQALFDELLYNAYRNNTRKGTINQSTDGQCFKADFLEQYIQHFTLYDDEYGFYNSEASVFNVVSFEIDPYNNLLKLVNPPKRTRSLVQFLSKINDTIYVSQLGVDLLTLSSLLKVHLKGLKILKARVRGVKINSNSIMNSELIGSKDLTNVLRSEKFKNVTKIEISYHFDGRLEQASITNDAMLNFFNDYLSAKHEDIFLKSLIAAREH